MVQKYELLVSFDSLTNINKYYNMKNLYVYIALLLCLSLLSYSQESSSEIKHGKHIKPSRVIFPSGFGVSKPLSQAQIVNIDSLTSEISTRDDIITSSNSTKRNIPKEFYIENDSDVQRTNGINDAIIQMDHFFGQVSYVYPTDPVGAVGQNNYYVQAVNSTISVYNKSGDQLLGPIDLINLFDASLPGVESCGSSIGDPFVIYDHRTNRWVLTAILRCTKNYLLIACTKSQDPTQDWYSWSYEVSESDYLKIGVGNNSYILSVNVAKEDYENVFALNRDAIINGERYAEMVSFKIKYPDLPNTHTGFHCMMPVDYDGYSGYLGDNHLITVSDDNQGNDKDELKLFNLHMDWEKPSTSYCRLSQSLPVKSFNGILDSKSAYSIPQPGSNVELDAISEILMPRAQFIQIDGMDKLVCVHTIAESSEESALRWYELERTTGSNEWSIAQQGTYNPDNISRWNASIAINNEGIIFMGYSVSNGVDVYPGIRYCAQSNQSRTSKTGIMDIPEKVIWEGGFSQESSNRWGDYSSVSVDPVDATFWYTNSFVSSSLHYPNKTTIAKVRIIECDELPTEQSNSLIVNEFSVTFVDFSWQRGDGDYVLVVARKQDTPIAKPKSGLSYNSSPYFGLGDTIGSGNFAVGFFEKGVNNMLLKNLNNGNGYYIDIYEAYSVDTDCYCYKTPAYTSLVCTQGIPCPYQQSFDDWQESSPGYQCTANGNVTLNNGWVNLDEDDIDWDILSENTASSSTGPTTDISLIGNYMYTEASLCSFRTGYLTSPIFDLTTLPSPSLNFYYHMWGYNMGSLSVEYSIDGGITWSGNLWNKTGDQGNQWHVASIPLSSYSQSEQFRIRFKSITGNNYKSDIAIDEVAIKTQTLGLPYLQTFDSWQTSNPWYSCTPDGSVVLSEEWKNATGDDVDWDVYEGSTISSYTGPYSGYMGNGKYLYMEASECYGQTGYLESPIFDLTCSNYPELKFYYHMFCEGSDKMGSLKVEISDDYGTTWEEAWSMEGNQGNQWNEAIIQLDAYNNIKGFVFRFVGITGSTYRSDIAIDHVSIDSPCESIFRFPYTMNFDSWTNSYPMEDCTPDASVNLEECWLNVIGDDIDWDVHSGSTVSSGTGPSTGYNGSGKYLYLESSYCWRKGASIKSPIFDFSLSHMRKPRLNFNYHMYGEGMGSFQVDISKDGGSNWGEDCIFSIYGNQGNQWNSAIIDLQEYVNESSIAYRFTGNTGRDHTSDIAFDEIMIYDECSKFELPYEEGFESWVNFSCQSSDGCNPNGSMDLLPYCWENSIDDDFDWGVGKGETPSSGTGPSSGSYGSYRYLYTEVSYGGCTNKEASVQSPDFDMSLIQDQPLLYFNYHMYGEDIGSLHLEISTDFGSSWTNLWAKYGNQGNQWLYEVIPLSDYISNPYVRLKFKAITGPGYTSDIAIDNIKISNGNRDNMSYLTTIQGGQDQKSETTGILSLYVFPNPNNGVFNLVINSIRDRDVNIKIVNTMGNTIYQQDNVVISTKHMSEINLSKYPKGAYYLIVISNKNDIIKKTIIYN
jgi:MAM domain-containing protein meprin/A5/mu/type IX secretion system substrate protein